MAGGRKSILVKLLIAYGAIVCACVLFVGLPLHLFLRRDYIANAAGFFEEQVRRFEPEIVRAAARGDGAALDGFCQRLNESFQGRVSIISAQGDVLGDSIGSLCLERARPECIERIRSALRQSRAEDAASLTMPDTVTLSAPLRLGEQPATARLALPLQPLHRQISTMHLLLLSGALGAGALAVIIGVMLGRHIARPLARMSRAAEDIAAGHFDSPVRLRQRDEIGRLAGAIDTMRQSLKADVETIQKERDQALAIVRNMSEGVLAIGPQGEVQLFNAAAERLLRLEGKLAPDAKLEDLAPHPALLECVRKVRQTGQSAQAQLGDLRDGGRVVALVAGPVGRGGGAVVVAHDVTEAHRIESMGRELVANASHELRTPLATISSTVETLLGGAAGAGPDAQSREFLEIIARQAARLRRLVEGTLQLSRIDALAGAAAAEQLEARDLAEEAAVAFAEEIKSKSQRLEVALSPDAGTLEGDGQLLLQALRNLLSNAVRYTPDGGSLGIRVARQDGWVLFEVWDKGPGIAPEDQRRIFERFFRGRAAQGNDEGVGLGLAIAERVARAHRGEILLRSKPGEGSSFTLRLPAAHSSPA